MFEMSCEFEIDYAHRLLGYPGDCRNFHGHRGKIVVILKGQELNELDMLIDFKLVKESMKHILADYDHRTLLNQNDGLARVMSLTEHLLMPGNPTAEIIAKDIYKKLKLNGAIGELLDRVEFYETPTNKVVYYENK